MGIHYINPPRSDPSLDPLNPEVLLYAQATGGLKLIGVEYIKADGDQGLATAATGLRCSVVASTGRCSATRRKCRSTTTCTSG